MRTGDAFGTALMDWVRGGTIAEIIERDDGHFEEGAGPEVYLSGVEGWPAAERRANRYLRGRIVDAGCGAGRVTRVLQKRGFDVVGIDSSNLAVRASRMNGVHGARCSPVSVLAREIKEFDSVLLYGNNLGVFGRPEQARRALSAWARNANPGTRVFVESTSPWGGGTPIVDRKYYQSNKARGLAPGVTRYRIHYEGLRSPWLNWFFASQTELRRIARGTGWEIERIVSVSPSEPYVAILERR